jgi:hypothetical protein
MTQQLARALTELQGIQSPEAPVLTAYFNLFPERLERRSLAPRLRRVLAPLKHLAASGELGHKASVSLRASIERVVDRTPELTTLLDPSVAFFICDEAGLDEQLPLPRRVWDYAVAGPAPYLRPLQATLDEFRKVAAVILDSRRAEIVLFYMGEATGRQLVEAEVLRKPNLAGWHGLEEHRNRQHAEEVHHHLFREVAERLDRLRRDQGIELVFLGGQHEVTHAALGFLDHQTRTIAKTFVIDVHTLTAPLLAKTVSGLEEEYERDQERRQVDEIYELAAVGGMAVVGVDAVLESAGRNAISELLVHDGVSFEGVICANCSALFRSGVVCRICGGKTKLVPELIEAAVRAVVESGGSVEHMMADTRLARDLLGARLRFVT